MNRTQLFLLATGLVSLAACTAAPEWRAVGLPKQSPRGWSGTWATATDSAGSVYVAGTFTDTIYFGTTRLISAGLTDVFVAKWLPATGRFAWAVRAGGDGHDGADALAVGRAGVFVAGSFSGYAADFGPDTLRNTEAGDGNDLHWHSNLFVTRLVPDGPAPRFAWTWQATGPGDERASALALRGRTLYLAGEFQSPALALGDTVLPNIRPADPLPHGFVASLHVMPRAPRLRWARRLSGSFSGSVAALAVADTGLVVAGGYQGAGVDLGKTPLPAAAELDAYVLKLLDRGGRSSVAWARAAGGPGFDYASALAVQGRRIYLAGSFGSATARFGAHLLQNSDTLRWLSPQTVNLRSDVFVAALDDVGPAPRFAWAHRLGAPADERAVALAVYRQHIYVAGIFRDSCLRLGPTRLLNPARGAAEQLFLACLLDKGPAGTCTWATQVSGPHQTWATTLARYENYLYLGGLLADSAQVGPVQVRTRDWNSRAAVLELNLPE